MARKWLLYGAYGYTGRLMVEEACRRGLTPLLAGRREKPLAALAEAHGLDYRLMGLEDSATLQRMLSDIDLVLHCAGSFIRTGPPMMAACLANGCHYLDLSGEIEVFRQAYGLDESADRAGVLLMPGAGFDVVPTDCLAAQLAERVPDATHLYLAFDGEGGMSPGTAKTSLEGLAHGGRILRDGKLVSVPWGYHHRNVDFGGRRCTVVTIPWGDVFTAYLTTGIPNIEVYMRAPERWVKRLKRYRWLRPLLGFGAVQGLLKAYLDRRIQGPGPERRKRSNSFIWGEVRNQQGQTATGRMLTPNSYTLSTLAAIGIVEHLLTCDAVPTGFHTPSQVMGKDYAASLPGVLVTMR